MARIVDQKNKEKQEEKIIKTAECLFGREGCDCASVNEIIKKLKIAKGTFYHYFPSKEDLINKMVVLMSGEIKKKIGEVIEQENKDALEKFNQVTRIIYTHKIANRKLAKIFVRLFYDEKNLVLHHKFTERNKKVAIPEFMKIFEQGRQEGIFTIKDSQITAEMMMSLGMSFFDSILPLVKKDKIESEEMENILKKADIYREAVGRILGVESEKLDIFNKKAIKKILG